jgi:ribosomal protein S18 acetylase RimI-like enzyme
MWVEGIQLVPKYRGRRYGRIMLNRLLEEGRKFGCSSFRLDTPKWAHAARHLYMSTGFTEREAYPGSEIPPMFQPYWIWMEKKKSRRLFGKLSQQMDR